MKKVWRWLLTVAALSAAAVLSTVSASAYETVFRYPAGSGTMLQVDYDASDKTLYISGAGDGVTLDDRDNLNFWANHLVTPWYKYRNVVKKIRFRRGVRTVLPGYFEDFSQLTEVYIPETVTKIYTEVFDNCPKLSKVYYEGTDQAKNQIEIYDNTLYDKRPDTSFWRSLEKNSAGCRYYSLTDSVLSLNGTRFSVIRTALFQEYELGNIYGRSWDNDVWEFDLDTDGEYDISVTLQWSPSGYYLNSGELKTLETASVDRWTLEADEEYRDFCLDTRQYFSRSITVALFEYVELSEECTFSLKNVRDYTYTGSQIRPATVLKYGSKTLIKGTNYVICSYRYNINAGTAQITALGKGRYTGKISTTFRIVPKKVTPVIKVKKQAVYSGAYEKPVLEVTADGKVLASSAYGVSVISGGRIVGPSKAKVTLKGNYSGSAAVSYKVLPRPTKITSLAGGAKSLVIRWTAVSPQTNGYEVQIARDKSFKQLLKKRNIAKPAIVRLNQTELPAKTACYVRIRTYKIRSGVKYYSSWSAAVSASTK